MEITGTNIDDCSCEVDVIGIGKYSNIEIPTLKLRLCKRVIEIINFNNQYYTILNNIRPSGLGQFHVKHWKHSPYYNIRKLLEINGFGENYNFINNCEIIIEYINLNTKFYNNISTLALLTKNKNELIAVFANGDAYIELIPKWDFKGLRVAVLAYGDALKLNTSNDNKLTSSVGLCSRFNLSLPVYVDKNDFFIENDFYKHYTDGKVQYHMINMGEYIVLFWIGTSYSTVPKNKWFMALYKNGVAISYIDLGGN